MRLALHTRDRGKGFWKTGTEPVEWTEKQWVSTPIKVNDDDFQTYTVKLFSFYELKDRIMQVALQPVAHSGSGFLGD